MPLPTKFFKLSLYAEVTANNSWFEFSTNWITGYGESMEIESQFCPELSVINILPEPPGKTLPSFVENTVKTADDFKEISKWLPSSQLLITPYSNPTNRQLSLVSVIPVFGPYGNS